MSGVNVEISRPDPDTDLLTYSAIRLYRGTSPEGTFSYASVSAALVSGTFSYTLNDSSGTTDSYYRYLLYNPTGPVLSDLSPVILPAALTLRRLRGEAVSQSGNGFVSACTALGAVGLLIDAALADNGVDEDFLRGAWIYRPDGDAVDKLRRIAASNGFDATASSLAPVSTRPWVTPPANAEAYELYNLFPPTDQPGAPYSWDRAVRDGLADVWFVDELTIGTGDSNSTRRFDISAHAAYVRRDYCRRVLLRVTDDNGNSTDFDASTNSWYWRINENVNGRVLELELSAAPGSNQTVILEVNRQDADLYIDTDVCRVPEDVAVAATIRAAYRRLNEVLQPGKFAAELAGATAAFMRVYSAPTPIVRGL